MFLNYWKLKKRLSSVISTFEKNVDVDRIGIIGDINDDNRIITEYSDILY